MTVGMLLAFLSYRSSFASSASSLVRQFQKWRLIGLQLERLSDIVGTKKEVIVASGRSPRHGNAPAIRVENLTFAYDADGPVLDRVSFNIPAGSMVAIVGPSGAGKTTLMRLLLGLLTPNSGTLEIDGLALGPANMAHWRARIGAVMQDDYLLTGTLADNISFFSPKLDQARVEASAQFAEVHEDIARMPMAYHSLVSDMGAALSSGQRQRILLARAIYRRPDVLFLDEGTANLDERTENVLAGRISELTMTRICVSHRPALVSYADIILHVENGQVVRDYARERAQPNMVRRAS
jgi:ATP-binding cassette subfamily B protein RaxB